MNRIEQIRRAHASARPKHDNPSWLHTHNDLTYVLSLLDAMQPVVNAASILERTWNSEDPPEHCQDEEQALVDAVFAYRTKLAGTPLLGQQSSDQLAPFICAQCGIPSSLDRIAGQFAHDRDAPHDHHPVRP